MKYCGWLLLFFSSVAFSAPDYAREKRLEEQIIEILFDAEPVYLDEGKHKFLAVYQETEKKVKGAVIILHGRGYHADWKQVVQPLRTGLLDHGWTTLSLQMPVLHKQAKYYDYVPIFTYAHPRIDSAIKFLQQKGFRKIILIAHSCGAHMAMSWARKTYGAGLSAYIGIGMGATDLNQKMKKPFPLDKLKMPVLDIYGEKDYRAVKRMAPGRLQAIQWNPLSKQVKVKDADHYFTGMGDELLKVVSVWLDNFTKKKKQKRSK